MRGRRRHCMLCNNPLTPCQRTTWKIVMTLEGGVHHARPTCHFLFTIPRRNWTWQRWRVANVCREDYPFPAFSGSRIGTRFHPDGVTNPGISGQWPPRPPRIVNATRSPCSVGSGEVKVTVDKHSGTWPSGFLDMCVLCPAVLTAGPDPIYFVRGVSSVGSDLNPLIRLDADPF